MTRFLSFLIFVYQRVISPWLPAHCRYQPTCSAYMLEAIEIHGPARGVRLGMARLLRCHPFAGAGYDPVPGKDGTDPEQTTTSKLHSR